MIARVGPALVLASGGVLPGAGRPVALVPMHGVALVVHAVRALLALGDVPRVTVQVGQAEPDRVRALFEAWEPVVVYRAGDPRLTRSMSASPAGAGVGLVHDVVHPLTPPALITKVVTEATGRDGPVVPVLPVTDTIRRLDHDGFLLDAPDRAGLRVVQAPLALPPRLLPGLDLTEVTEVADVVAQLTVRPGPPVHTVPGDPLAFPLRDGGGLALAERLTRA